MRNKLHTPLHWQKTESLTNEDYRVFSVERVKSVHTHSNRAGIFSVIHSPDWVNILAITSTDEVVLIRQYRHGTDTVVTEIPGGMIDPGESPLAAAQRELTEETGYTAETWVCLGVSHPNPAIQDNRCFMYLALDAVQSDVQTLDPNEVIEIDSKPLSSLPDLVHHGVITHALVLTCLSYFTTLSGGWIRPTPEKLAQWSVPYVEHAEDCRDGST